MSKLTKLYELLERQEELGINFSDDVLKQINQLEEDLIKHEILPIVQNNIEPALRPVKRDLVIVVEYSPDSPIKVKLSRKINITDALEAKVIEPDPQVEHKETGKTKKQHIVKAPQTTISITLPDGRIIAEKKASDTLIEFIKYVGVMRVRSLGIIRNKVPLISNTKDAKYGSAQHPVGGGWYVITHSDTNSKKKLVEKIARELNIKVKVEIK